MAYKKTLPIFIVVVALTMLLLPLTYWDVQHSNFSDIFEIEPPITMTQGQRELLQYRVTYRISELRQFEKMWEKDISTCKQVPDRELSYQCVARAEIKVKVYEKYVRIAIDSARFYRFQIPNEN